MTLNIPALERVAAWLEAGAPESANHGLKFDMGDTLCVTLSKDATADNWCGTTCCIAGAAIAFERPDYVAMNIRSSAALWGDDEEGDEVDVLDPARDLLGLTEDQADTLFIPWNCDRSDQQEAVPAPWESSISPAWAARTIRHLIATGEVDWKATKVTP